MSSLISRFRRLPIVWFDLGSSVFDLTASSFLLYSFKFPYLTILVTAGSLSSVRLVFWLFLISRSLLVPDFRFCLRGSSNFILLI